MRLTHIEREQLKDVFHELEVDMNLFDIVDSDKSKYQIVYRPENFLFAVTRRKSGYVVKLLYPDLQPKPDVSKASMPDVLYLFRIWLKLVWSEIKADSSFIPRDTRVFDPLINQISPRFEIIYNQASKAESLGLSEICGTGFRKALEFLIKDYLISNLEKKHHKTIKKSSVVRCLDKFGNEIKEEIIITTERAIWLGNDHSHYRVVWKDKTLDDLKSLILDTAEWIGRHEKTKDLKREMPNRKNIE